MFDGEFASLKSIQKSGCVRVPTPIAVLDDPNIPSGAMLVMENIDIWDADDLNRFLNAHT